MSKIDCFFAVLDILSDVSDYSYCVMREFAHGIANNDEAARIEAVDAAETICELSVKLLESIKKA